MTALNPVHTIGRQVGEPLRLHRGLSAAEARKEALALLERVGIPDAALAPGRLPAPVLGRPAPAHRHRDGAGLRARPADRRRADHRARRHDPEADPRPDPRPGRRARHGADPDLARPRRDRRERLADARDVRRQRGRKRARPPRCSPSARIPTRRACSRPGRRSARRAASSWRPFRGSVPELVDLPPGCPFAGRCRFTIDACQRHAAAAGAVCRTTTACAASGSTRSRPRGGA